MMFKFIQSIHLLPDAFLQPGDLQLQSCYFLHFHWLIGFVVGFSLHQDVNFVFQGLVFVLEWNCFISGEILIAFEGRSGLVIVDGSLLRIIFSFVVSFVTPVDGIDLTKLLLDEVEVVGSVRWLEHGFLCYFLKGGGNFLLVGSFC